MLHLGGLVQYKMEVVDMLYKRNLDERRIYEQNPKVDFISITRPGRPVLGTYVLGLHEQQHGVPVHAGMESQPDCPPDGAGHLPLVRWSETSLVAVLDPAERCHVFGDHGEVLANHN